MELEDYMGRKAYHCPALPQATVLQEGILLDDFILQRSSWDSRRYSSGQLQHELNLGSETTGHFNWGICKAAFASTISSFPRPVAPGANIKRISRLYSVR